MSSVQSVKTTATMEYMLETTAAAGTPTTNLSKGVTGTGTAAAPALVEVLVDAPPSDGNNQTPRSSAGGSETDSPTSQPSGKPNVVAHFFGHTLQKKAGQARRHVRKGGGAFVDGINNKFDALSATSISSVDTIKGAWIKTKEGAKADSGKAKAAIKCAWFDFSHSAKNNSAKVADSINSSMGQVKAWLHKEAKRTKQAVKAFVVCGSSSLPMEGGAVVVEACA